MAQTTRLLITLLEEAQAGKVEAINEALNLLDAGVGLLDEENEWTGDNGWYGATPVGAASADQVVTERLDELGLSLPQPFSPPEGVAFPFELVTVSGELAYISGHGPIDGSTPLMRGKVGGELTVERGYEAARLTGTNLGPWAGVAASGLPVDLQVLILFPWDPLSRRFLGERIWFDRGQLQRTESRV